MKAKTFITSCCLFAIMACGTAFAQQSKIMSGPYQGPKVPMVAPDAVDAIIYTNLGTNDACTNCNYSSANGFFILGPTNCFAAGSTQWIAYPFIATRTQAVRQILLAITNDTAICTPTSSKFTVQLYDNLNCNGIPSNPLGNPVTATSAIAPCALANANFAHAGVTLTVGVTYWVVVTTSTAASQMGTTAVWWEVNGAVSAANFNDGNGWGTGPLGGPGGFQVQ